MRVAICGGGVIGACVAYYLSLRQVQVTVLESTGVACAASGKSGGFLALDWCDGTPVGPLARRSFALHATLAASLDRDWGYRRLDTIAAVASLRRGLGHLSRFAAPDWLAEESAVHARLGTVETTAQIDPATFTRAMMDAAVAHGADLRIATVTGLAFADDGAASGVAVGDETIAADAVVLAMGPWSAVAAQWLPLPPIYGLKGHSLVFDHDAQAAPPAVFAEFEDADGTIHSPEIFPRPDGTTYVCGLSSQTALPADPADVAPDPGATERLQAMTARIAPTLGHANVLSAQACFRPIVADGLPLIGHVPGVPGAFVATGHSVWGMLNAPATGEAMAELIVDGAASTVDIAAFDPARLAAVSN